MKLTKLLAVSLLIGGSTVQAELRIHHLDVNQSDSTIFVGPTGRSLLIDTGENGMGDDICKAVTRAGITKIDALITTHYHQDHYGGVDELVACGIPIDKAYDRGHKAGMSGKRFEDYQAAVGSTAIAVKAGYLIPFDTDVTVRVVAANGSIEGESDIPTGEENDDSVAVVVSYKGFTAFYGGDLEVHTEDKLSAGDIVKNISLYQANHHGADNGSSRDFLDDMKPKVIIISNGNHKGHAHPRKSAVERMQNTVPTPVIFQTNKFTSTSCQRCPLALNVADDFIADLDPEESDGSIDVVVDDDGSFSVQVNRVFGPY
jgi:competence protein ComEC